MLQNALILVVSLVCSLGFGRIRANRSDQRTLQSQCSVRDGNVNVIAMLKWRGAPGCSLGAQYRVGDRGIFLIHSVNGTNLCADPSAGTAECDILVPVVIQCLHSRH